ncbi:MAG: methyltransferase domain-containing protein [Acidimicrobiaceae bacterium]|nr:methyltransferase domain-containing protein [Acidimicrobiaceae bacterium]MDE0318839.1 methyltransferase domain-containing protein [Acidimicrobiaceae bacterium]MDE0498157.1 methyltransferase domain-containing protein [Acidimicrobiaceae bacterium]
MSRLSGASEPVVKANSGGSLREALDDFLELQRVAADPAGDRAEREQPHMVSRFYDVVTKFYEYGWGKSFHFAPRNSGESLHAAQGRQETGVVDLLGLGPGSRVVDVGCGVGGPLVNIAQQSGASITGLNFNAYQIERGWRALRRAGGVRGTCDFLLADYMDVPLADGRFDAAYSFEAICHAPDRHRCLAEIWRLLKPGGQIALTEWCLTDRFDEQNPIHRDIRARVEFANATPSLPTTSGFVAAVQAAGFKVLSSCDQAIESDPDFPWYRALQGRDLSLASLARVPAGRRFTAKATALLERLRVAPAGTGESARILNEAADALVQAGEEGIFTPCFLVHARKPDAVGGEPSGS